MKDTSKNISNKFAAIFNCHPEIVRLLQKYSPSYRYYENKNKDRFFYTTHKISHKQGKKFVAGIYRFIKSKNVLKLTRRVGFAKKKDAKAWAHKEYKWQ